MVLLYLKLVGFVLVQLLLLSVVYRIPEFIWGRSYKEKVYNPIVGFEVENTVDTRKKIHVTGGCVVLLIWFLVMVSAVTRGFDLLGISIPDYIAILIVLSILFGMAIVGSFCQKSRPDVF